MQDRFKVRCYVTENEGYPEKIGYVNTEDFYIHPEGDVCFFNADYDYAECVVEQCTGLKDKNGKLIYEGDILAVPYVDPIFMQPFNMEVNNDVAYVESYKGCFVAHYPEKQKKYLYDYENIAEVIGNIHENPDLLENKDE